MGMACIFLTFTRGCWLSAIIVLLGLATMYPKTVLTILAIVIPVAVPLAGGVLADEVAFALERLNTQETVDSRVILAHAGQQMFYQKPIFGWGFSNYDRYDWLFIERAGSAVPTLGDIRYGTSHNTYLTVLAETGVVGFFLQFFPVFWWLGLTIKVFPRMPRTGVWGRDRLVGLWLSILFYITSSQVVDMRFFWYHIGLLWLTLGLIATIVQAYLPPPAAITPLWMQLAAKPKQSRM
jgi:O-antigen ligase